jgi:hypothetical protein
MTITIKEVETSKEYKTFIYLPEKIHKGHKNWLPPIYIDEKKFFDPAKNPSFDGCDSLRLLAYKDGKPAGRIMGIINRKHNELCGLKNARFGYLECWNDPKVSHALLGGIEEWGKSQGMNKIVGPYGFSDRDVQGLLIEGFEYEPIIDSACNCDYLPGLVTREGYTKELDCAMFRYPLNIPIPAKYETLYNRITSRGGFNFFEFTSRKQFKPYIIPVFRLVNEAFRKIYGFIPLTEKEMFHLAAQYSGLLDPKFVKIVEKNGEVVAFSISMPNMYKGIQKARGRLLPFGLLYILRAMRTAESVDFMLGAVKDEYRKNGLDLFLFISTLKTALKAGMKNIETHTVMEKNNEMMAIFERYGAFQTKKFRVYQKSLV